MSSFRCKRFKQCTLKVISSDFSLCVCVKGPTRQGIENRRRKNFTPQHTERTENATSKRQREIPDASYKGKCFERKEREIDDRCSDAYRPGVTENSRIIPSQSLPLLALVYARGRASNGMKRKVSGRAVEALRLPQFGSRERRFWQRKWCPVPIASFGTLADGTPYFYFFSLFDAGFSFSSLESLQ